MDATAGHDSTTYINLLELYPFGLFCGQITDFVNGGFLLFG